MAFRFGSAGLTASGASAGGFDSAQSQTGPDLEEIETEALGFQSLGGEAKLRLLPLPWPSDALPPPTSSLLSVASKKGLLAAAGPDSVIIASTESVRQSFTASSSSESNFKPFTPQLILNVGTRISQLAFSTDEKYLVISAESGGGLGVYNVGALMQGNTTPAFELPTNGTSLRALIPNPAPEKAELFAVVTTKGELMIGNLTTRLFLNGAQGQVMKDGVSCVSWSTKGKQLVVGLGNGTCFQLTPEGDGKGELPRPPDTQGDEHVSSISWLENNLFLTAHTPTTFDAETIPLTVFHLVTRQPTQPYACTFQKIPEPCLPYGLNRSPPFHYVQRLKDFPPNLQDLIVVASTASTDVGVLTRSKVPLTNGTPAEKVTDVFTTTTMAIDSRRAQLPMTEDLSDTSPIGMALDLSNKEKVSRPLPSEEMEESSTPLPAIMILNNDGVLSSWWLVYADSVRQATTYPGLTIAGVSQPQVQNTMSRQASPFGDTTSQATLTPNVNPFGTATTFGNPSTPAFGTSSALGTAPSVFGTSAALGKPQSPWATSNPRNPIPGGGTSSFGQPSFGAPSSPGSTSGAAFGATGAIGNRASPWGAPQSGSSAASGSIFGQPGALGMGTSSANPFAPKVQSGISAPTSTGGFAPFANGTGFMGAPAQSSGDNLFSKVSGDSPFIKPSTGASFGSTMETDSSFGGTPKKPDAPGSFFPGTGFTLGSTFKGDGTAGNDSLKPAIDASNSFFGSTFGNTLGEAQKVAPAPLIEEADMADSADENDKNSEPLSVERESSPPDARPDISVPKTTPPLTGGFFGTQSQTEKTPAAVQNSAPAPPSSWDKPTPVSTTPQETPRKPLEIQTSTKTPSSPVIKPEPRDDGSSGIDDSIPEPPLPPESTSKVSYGAGDSSNSSASTSKAGAEDAPLRPEFTQSKSKGRFHEASPLEQSSLPSDNEDGGLDEGLDDEGSGVDVAKEISPTTAESSFSGAFDKSSFDKSSFDKGSLGGLFTKVKPPQPQKSKSLFGEVSLTSVPYFPPPIRVQESPRSPSPVRSFLQGDLLRSANARSVSALGHPAAGTGHSKGVPRKTVAASSLQVSVEDNYKEKQNRAAGEHAKRAAEEQSLSDHEDEEVREFLETEVQSKTTLDPFLAHQDYVGKVDKPGVPGQIEKVFRDINSMIDTLGLNARSLKSFVKGQSEMYNHGGRSRDNLENDGDWCLIEIGDLEGIESTLSEGLDQGRVNDLQERLHTCQELRKGLRKFKAKAREVDRYLDAMSDPEKIKAARLIPLDIDQSALQNRLRKTFTRTQKLLADVEGEITMFKTALAAQDTRNGKGAVKKPTVEAVTNTIMKMTRMAEQKSGDIDVIETQMRRLRLLSTTATTSDDDNALANTLSSMRISHGPRNTRRSLLQTPNKPNASLRDSITSNGTPKKGISDVTTDEVQRYRDRMRRRQAVNKVLKEAFLAKDVVVRGLE